MVARAPGLVGDGGFRGGSGDGGGRGGVAKSSRKHNHSATMVPRPPGLVGVGLFRGGCGGVRGGVRSGVGGPFGGCPYHLIRRGGRVVGVRRGAEVEAVPHLFHAGVFIATGKDPDALCTKNMFPGVAPLSNDKSLSVENEDGTKTEYRLWNPIRSKLAAAILNGLNHIWIKPGDSVLYLGAASGTTVSHVSDIVGPNGVVYAVELCRRSGKALTKLAKKRTNIIPILEDARHPDKYKMLVGMVDVICSDVAQPDQARILALNASYFLKVGGHFVTSIKADCIDSTEPAKTVFAVQVKRLKADEFEPFEQVTLEPYERGVAVVVGGYRTPKELIYAS